MSAQTPNDGSWAVLRWALRDTGVRPWAVVRAVLAGTMALGSAVGLAATAAWLIARAAELPSPADLALAAVAVRFFGIARGLFRYIERLASHDTALSGMAVLRERTYERLAASASARLLSLSRGDIIARIGADMDSIGDAVVRAIIPTGVAVTVSLISVTIVAAILPWAGLVLAASLAVAGVGTALLTARQARLAAQLGVSARADVTEASLSAIESAAEHKVWGTWAEVRADLDRANRSSEEALDKAAVPAAHAAGVLALAQGASLIASIAFAVLAVRSGEVTGPLAAVVALVPLAAFEAVSAIPGAVMQAFRSQAAAQRIADMTAEADSPLDQAEAPLATPPAAKGSLSRLPKHPASAGALVLDGLSAARPGMVPTAPVTTSALPGQVIAIKGESGIGKSTLLLTIAGALEPHAGSVTVGGAAASQALIGPVMALTAEDAHVFGTTVLENLRVARADVTVDDALEAVEAVGLTAWLDSLPDGLDTMVGSGGGTVSGGERRRLLLARALLHSAPVALLDEAAEHLDASGMEALAHAVSVMKSQGKVVVIVTHHDAPLELADRAIDLGEAERA